jgi:hypothetical protein
MQQLSDDRLRVEESLFIQLSSASNLIPRISVNIEYGYFGQTAKSAW